MKEDRHDEFADAWLTAALLELREVPDDVDWDGLHQSIHDRAELVFARRGKQRVPIVRRPFVPLALAASLALTLWSGPAIVDRITGGSVPAIAVVDLDSEAILREALSEDLTEQEFNLLVTGRSNPEVLLAAAVDRR